MIKETEVECYLSVATEITSLLVKDASVTDLWKLDIIGIKDPIEVKSLKFREEAREHFLKTVVQIEDGRYQVSLPWINQPRQIPNDIDMAEKRLITTTAKL